MRRSNNGTHLGRVLRGATALIGFVGVASLALSAHFARKVLTPAQAPDERVTVWAIEPSSTAPTGSRVWIHGPDASLDGRYSFIWAAGDGHARLGDVIDSIFDNGVLRVCRDVLTVDRGKLERGLRGRITGWWFIDAHQLDLDVQDVEIPVKGGHARAWVVRSDPGTETPGRWAVHVHGRGADPAETLRGVTPLARAGFTSLVITYRNDSGAPTGSHGRYGLGLAEHADVDDAISFARTQGADRVTLVGWSMGATAAILSATHGPFRNIVDGLVLDSPAVDWPSILRQQARLAGLPQPFATLAMMLMQRGWVRGAIAGARGTDLASLTVSALSQGLHVPTLIHASPEDTFVPWEGALQLARQYPSLVVLRHCGGEHVKLWNVDPQSWEEATEKFVRSLDTPRHVSRD